MKKLTTLLLCLVAISFTTNANTYFVDTSKGTNGLGGSWSDAFNTISAAESAANAVGGADNIYIKGALGGITISSGSFWTLKAENYYFSCDAENSGTSTNRTLVDKDGNGIIESWEFKCPTIYSSTYSGGNAINLVASTLLDGLSISNTATKSNANTSSFVNPIGGVVQNCIFSGSTLTYNSISSSSPGGCLIKSMGDFKDCLIEKNSVTVNITGNYQAKIAPIFEFNFSTTAVNSTLSRCVFRNNTANISSSATATFTGAYIRGLIINVVTTTTANQSATINDCLVYNNEISYTNTGNITTLASSSILGVLNFSNNTTTDKWVNNIIANNKLTNCNSAMFVVNNTTQAHYVYNNVFWNNQNNGTVVSMNSAAGSGGQGAGTVVSNNVMDFAATGTWVGSGSSTFSNNLSDLSTTNATATYGPQFVNPPLNSGSNIIGSYQSDGTQLTAINQADWRLNSSSYLIAKGATTTTTGIAKDKSDYHFSTATNPASGAYEAVPIITTTDVTPISDNSATSGGTIVWNGGSTITASGVCYSTSQNPTTANSTTTENATSGSFTSNITGLSAGVTYYLRAYATNGTHTTYGMQQRFTTLSSKPKPTNQATNFAKGAVTSSAIPLTFTSAVTGAQAPDGYLIKMSTGTVSDPVDATDPSDVTAFTGGVANVKASASPVSSFTGLTAGTLYHYKIYSYTNSGAQISFNTTSAPALDVATSPAAVTGVSFTPTFPDATPPFNSTTFTANLSWTNPASFDAVNHTTLVFVKYNSAITVGTPINAASTYIASSNMVSGSTGTVYQGDASAYCVYKGTGTSVSLSGMTTGANYYVMIITVYNSSNSDGTYSYSSGATASAIMYKKEAISYTTNLAVSNVSSTSISLTWTPSVSGSQAPDGYMVVSKALSSVPYPVDGTDQSDVTAFTSSVANVKIAPQSATGMSSFTNMTPGTTYFYKVFPYTNSGVQINYKTSGTPANLNYATTPSPVTSVSLNPTTETTATISWTLPAGYAPTRHSTLVFLKAGNSISNGALTNSPTSYTASNVLGSGTTFQNDAAAYCVFNGDGSSVSISGLTSNNTYQVLVYTVVDLVNYDASYSYSAAGSATGATILDAPSIVSVAAGDQSVAVNFTAPALNGGSSITDYKYSINGGSSFTSANSTTNPIVIRGLTNAQSVSVILKSVNTNGDGAASVASGSVTPSATANIIAIDAPTNSGDLNLTPVSDIAVSGSTLTVNGSPTVNSVTIASDAKLDLSGTNTLSITGDLLLKANGTNSFSANIGSGTLAVTGAIKYLRTIDDKKWYFMAFPSDVTIAQITATNTPLGILGIDWFIKYYDGAKRGTSGPGDNWISITADDVTADPTLKLNKYQGYIFGLANLKPATELSFPLIKAEVSTEPTNRKITVAANNAGNISSTNHGWNLIGQPYLSQFVGKDGSNESYTSGATAYNIYVYDGTSTYTPYTQTSVPNINPMSAYFIQASSGLAGSGITFNTAGRQTIRSLVSTDYAWDKVQLNLTTNTGTDYTLLTMDNNLSNDYEIGYDLEKWIGTGTDKPQVYTQLNGINYAFNALPMNSVNNLPLGIYTKNAGNTTISLNSTQAPSLSKLILTDYATSPATMTDLLIADYSFTAAAGTDNARFVITAQRISTGNVMETETNGPQIIVNNSKLIINNLIGSASVRVVDAIGRIIANKVLNNSSIEILLPVTGMYSIQIESGSKNWTRKVVNQ